MLSFFPRGVLDEILNLIESVSEGFSSYSCKSGAKETHQLNPDRRYLRQPGTGVSPVNNELFYDFDQLNPIPLDDACIALQKLWSKHHESKQKLQQRSRSV